MSIKPIQPAIDRTHRLLKEGLGKGIWKRGDRLPSLEKLAHLYGVSRNSVWRAMQNAKGEGLVSITPRGLITAGKTDTVDTAALSSLSQSMHGTIWRKKMDLITSDITQGRFSHSQQLPAAKELQALYSASQATIRKILHALSAAGLVHHDHRRYSLNPATAKNPSTRVVLLAEGGETRENFQNTQLYQIVNTLEQAHARNQADVDFVNLDVFNPEMATRLRSQLSKQEAPAGYLLVAPDTADPQAQQRVSNLAAWLAGCEAPVAILAGPETLAIPNIAFRGANTRVFHPARSLCGTQVGQFLLGHGHRSIVYVSHVHASAWSRDRLAGLKKTFALAGFSEGIKTVLADNIESQYEKDFRLASLKPEQSALLAESRKKPELLKVLLKEISNSSMTNGWDARSISSVKEGLQTLMQLAGINSASRLYGSARDAFLAEMALNMNMAVFESLFQNALTHTGATAWVAANDGLALKAVQFLKRKKIRVPEDVSVIGFDNTIEALESKLTSYDFDIPGIIHKMLWFVLHYDRRKRNTGLPPEEVSGYVVERNTTKK